MIFKFFIILAFLKQIICTNTIICEPIVLCVDTLSQYYKDNEANSVWVCPTKTYALLYGRPISNGMNLYASTSYRLYCIPCGTCSQNKYKEKCRGLAQEFMDYPINRPDVLPTVPIDEDCKNCLSCRAGQANYGCEDLVGPGTCQCKPGFGTEACTACSTGSYKSDKGSQGCSLCPIGKYQSQQAQASCVDCPLQSTSNGNVQTFADNTGFVSCSSCQQWTALAGIGQYITPCTASSDYKISSCAKCGSGYYLNKDCTTSTTGRVFDSNNVPTCVSCSAGTFSFSPDGGLQTSCTVCSAGFYQNEAQKSSCKTCANSKPSTAQYASWGNTVPSSATCPWSCKAGYYKSKSKCLACAIGQYSVAGGTCQSCTNKPLNSYYLATSRTDRAEFLCKWACNSGFEKVGDLCVPCQTNFYSVQSRTDENSAEIFCSQCSQCNPGFYISTSCSLVSNTVCTPCKTTCGLGSFISLTCNGVVDNFCTKCKTSCNAGQFLFGSCPGNGIEDIIQCLNCITPNSCELGTSYLPTLCNGNNTSNLQCIPCTTRNCPLNQYATFCTLTQDSVCTNYTKCSSNNYLKNFGPRQNGVCTGCSTCSETRLSPCSLYKDTVCVGRKCNSTNLCDKGSFCLFQNTADSGFCTVCPNGYSSDGLDCKTCPKMFTCDVNGNVVCQGELTPYKYGFCNGNGFAEDTESCGQETQSTISKVVRGGYIKSDVCTPYFECFPGYYFSISPAVSCTPCTATENLNLNYFLSNGLQNYDFSCIMDCKYGMNLDTEACLSLSIVPTKSNAPGQYFLDNNLYQCPTGYTSPGYFSVGISSCIQCDLVANTIGNICSDYVCISPFVKRGSTCYVNEVCPKEGFIGDCAPAPLPLQPRGYEKTGITIQTNFTSILTSNIITFSNGYIQDYKFGATGRHKLFWSSKIINLPGPVCSVSSISNYVFVYFCNTTFITFYNMNLTTPKPRLLIGRNQSGYLEDYKLEAMFGSELYIASHPTQMRLFVVDKYNCVLREIVIKQPGHYLTRSHLLYGTPNICYGLNSLQWPEKLIPVFNSQYYLFVTDDGMYQLHTTTMMISFMFSKENLKSLVNVEVASLDVLIIKYQNRLEIVKPDLSLCPSGFTSLFGGDCIIVCTVGLYWVNLTSGICQQCQTVTCGVGEELVPCSAHFPAYCKPCGPLPSNAKYFLPNNCLSQNVYYVHPCPKNMYLLNNKCVDCPFYSETVYTGAISVDECRCFEGVKRKNGICVVDQLYNIPYAPKCDFLSYPRGGEGDCQTCFLNPLPECKVGEYTTSQGTCAPCIYPNFSIVTGNGIYGDNKYSCPWSCLPGYFPNTSQPIETRCQVCTSKPDHTSSYYTTNGQDDAPKSCVWKCNYPYVRRVQDCVVCDYKGNLPSCRNPLLNLTCPLCNVNVSFVNGIKYKIFNCSLLQSSRIEYCNYTTNYPVLTDFVIVGGGGAGGTVVSEYAGGGGGAGEVLFVKNIMVNSDVYMFPAFRIDESRASYIQNALDSTIIINPIYSTLPIVGQNLNILSATTFLAHGGGMGASRYRIEGSIGGSGGGGRGLRIGVSAGGLTRGEANVNIGGNGNARAGGGGGGAGSAGENALSNTGGNGGNGLDLINFLGYSYQVAGGGAGGCNIKQPNCVPGKGTFGGGDPSKAALPNTGSGGGGGMYFDESFIANTTALGGTGSNGIIFARYVDEECLCVES